MELRLFPLHTVLFPAMPIHLQVFEPRYRQLVAECLEHATPFGVVLIREGEEVGGPAVPFEVGTSARITSVLPGSGERIHVRAVGVRRFHIVALHDDRPYPWADVEWLADAGAADEALLEQARTELALLRRLRATANGEYERDPQLPAGAGAIADRIGALADAERDEAQQVLETLDAGRRLELAMPLLRHAVKHAYAGAAEAALERWAAPGMAN